MVNASLIDTSTDRGVSREQTLPGHVRKAELRSIAEQGRLTVSLD